MHKRDDTLGTPNFFRCVDLVSFAEGAESTLQHENRGRARMSPEDTGTVAEAAIAILCSSDHFVEGGADSALFWPTCHWNWCFNCCRPELCESAHNFMVFAIDIIVFFAGSKRRLSAWVCCTGRSRGRPCLVCAFPFILAENPRSSFLFQAWTA